MRYRRLDANGDYTFGQSQANFLANSPETVAQAVKTRLLLSTGEWFLNLDLGTPYQQQILGARHNEVYDQAIKQRILGTEGVTEIVTYQSTVDTSTDALTVEATINTLYGITSITVTG